MKKLYFISLFISFSFYGQIVNIPDANFKNALVNTNCAILIGQAGLTDVDANNDGEIQLTEALNVERLDVNNQNIASLIGISNFSNIHYLICTENVLDELNLVGLYQINYIECGHNQLTSLDFSELNALTGISCGDNLLTTLILPTSPNQTTLGLDCSHNQLTQLDLSGFTWSALDISYNSLSNIDIPYTAFCENLNISGNQYSSISINAGEIVTFYCSDTQLVNLNLSGVNYFHYDFVIKNNLNLQHLNMKNDHADFCFDIPGDASGPGEICPFFPEISNNPSLNLFCIDAISQYNYAAETLISETEYYAALVNNPNVVFSTECILSTKAVAKSSEVIIYPNPVQNILHVSSNSELLVQTIKIYNILGQQVKTVTPTEKMIINVADLKAGVYLITVESADQKTTKRFIKL